MNTAPHRGVVLLIALVVAAITVVAFLDARHNTFHFDDHSNITNHAPIRVERFDLGAFWNAALAGVNHRRVLANLSFAVDWWRSDGKPGPFLVTNIALHALNAALAFLLLVRVLGAACPAARRAHVTLLAALAALVWALHPIQVQAVTYVVQRMTSMAALFMLISLLAWIRARTAPRHRGPWFAICALAFAAGALSKENAWMTPALIGLTEYTVLRRDGVLLRGAADRIVWVGAAVAAGLVVLDLIGGLSPLAQWIEAGYRARDFTLAERLLTQPRVLTFYLSLYLLPLPGRFSIEHGFATSTGLLAPPETALAIGGLAVWCAAGVWLARRPGARRIGAWLVLLPPLALAVESSVVPLEMVFEHRMYFPSLGLAGLVAWTALLVLARRPRLFPAAAALLCAIAAGLAWSSGERLAVWRTELALYRDALEHAPESARVWGSLALFEQRAGRAAEALAAYERALALDRRNIELFVNRASLLIALGRAAEARADLQQASFLNPRDPGLWMNLGVLRWRGGDAAGALEALERAIEIAPDLADAYFNRALIQRRRGDVDAAESDYVRTLERDPRHLAALVNLASIARTKGEPARALSLLERALAVSPADPDARFLRAETLSRVGREREALADLDRLIASNPAERGARALRGTIRARLGDVRGARDDLRRACDAGVRRACAALATLP